MEKEQLDKKLEWLDNERRKAVASAAEFETRIDALEKTMLKRSKTTKARQGTDGAQPSSLLERVERLEKELKAYRLEITKEIQESVKQQKAQGKDLSQSLNKVLEDFRKEVGEVHTLKKTVNAQGESLLQLAGKFQVFGESVEGVIAGEQRRAQVARSLEENSKKDVQRLTEMHGEVAALLARLENAAQKNEIIADAQHKVEKRMDELVQAEEKRRGDQKTFFDQALAESEKRQKQWQEWNQRFEQVELQSAEIGQRLKDIETTDLAVKRAQKAFDELIEKINRRVNELGEIQRLGDQRFRQEWSTFQADVQKRWANFTLTNEEELREDTRQREKLTGQLIQLEDTLREIQDNLQHLSEQSERNLQTLLELARDSLAENERFLSARG